MKKSQQDRLTEVLDVRRKLRDLGISKELVPNLGTLFERMDDYFRHGTTWSGKIKLTEIDKMAHVKLSNQRPSTVVLKEYPMN